MTYGHSRELETAAPRRADRCRVPGDDRRRGGVQLGRDVARRARRRRGSGRGLRSHGGVARPWPVAVVVIGSNIVSNPSASSRSCCRWCWSPSPSAPRPHRRGTIWVSPLAFVPFMVGSDHPGPGAERPGGWTGVFRRALGGRRGYAGSARTRRGAVARADRWSATEPSSRSRRPGTHPDRPGAPRHRVALDQRGDYPDPGRTPALGPGTPPRRPTWPRSRRRPARRWRRCAGSSVCCATMGAARPGTRSRDSAELDRLVAQVGVR